MPKVRSLAPRVGTASLSHVRPQARAEHDRYRGTSSSRGYDYRWQQARKGWLAKHPLCVHCDQKGFVTEATEVDHIVPHRGDMNVFWDRNNWQSLCKPCHSAKTASGQ